MLIIGNFLKLSLWAQPPQSNLLRHCREKILILAPVRKNTLAQAEGFATINVANPAELATRGRIYD
jgi:hypothetical protein